MIRIKPALVAPIASIMIFVMGSGFYTTITTLHLTKANIDTWVIGCISSAYFCGLLISAFRAQFYILRVGHIRAFATFAAFIAVTTLLQGLFFSPTLWVFLRFVAGYGLAGVAVVVESWLLDSSGTGDRGTVLAIYMFAFYFAQSMSQLFLRVDFAMSIEPYCTIAILSAIAIIPVCMTRFNAPCPEEPSILPFRYLLKRVPLGVCGCFIAGLLLGPIYTLLPDYLIGAGKEKSEIGLIMMTLILGGTLLQYPIGRLSDKYDRMKVLLYICLGATICFVAFIPDYYSTPWLMGLGFIMGGFTFTVYPLCISHTIDHIKQSDMISAISTLLLAFGAGSAIGPLIAPGFTIAFGPNGLCFYLLFIGVVLIIFTTIRLISNKPYKYDEHVDFVSIPRTTPNAVPDPLEQQEQETS